MVDNGAHDIPQTDLFERDEMTEANSAKSPVNGEQLPDAYPMLELNTVVLANYPVFSGVEDIPSSNVVRSQTIFSWYQSNMAVWSNIASFGMIGCAIRIGLERLLSPSLLNIEFAGSIIPVSFFSNMLGSFILGLLAGSTLKSLPGMSSVYTGLSTGLCGSITTYSKFNQQISLMIVGEAETDGDQYFTAFAAILVGIAAPICSFEFGRDISKEIRKIRKKESGTDFGTSRTTKFIKIFNYTSIGFLITLWVTLLTLSIVFADIDEVIFTCVSIVMAPFGAVLRFLLAKCNGNPTRVILNIQFPLGTFYANFIGSLILALIDVALTWTILSCPWYNVLRAVQTGFCACLSTVSTFVAEISGMRESSNILSSHLYPFLTIFLCEVVACITNGVSYGLYTRDSAIFQNVTCV